MDINWKEFISYDFWFGIDRVMLHLTDRIIFYFAIGFVVIGIALCIYTYLAKNIFLKEVARKFASIFITIGILEGLWFGLRYQLVQALGTHFAAAVVLLVGIVWLYWPVKYLITRYRTDMQEAQRKIMRDKYL